MQVTKLSDVEPRPRLVAVGEFDGVHLGHREVIAGSDTVLTFEPHPLAVIRPEARPKLLTSLEAKIELIEQLGVRELVVIGFDETFAAQSPEEFIEQVLVGRLQATRVSVGENFRFGHRATGDTQLLAADGASRPESWSWSRSTGRSSPRVTSVRSCRPETSTTRPAFWAGPSSCGGRS